MPGVSLDERIKKFIDKGWGFEDEGDVSYIVSPNGNIYHSEWFGTRFCPICNDYWESEYPCMREFHVEGVESLVPYKGKAKDAIDS
ncbi:hypothetical protein K8R33_04510 [archaeon]|nr:hypothetical protein [archaeon]